MARRRIKRIKRKERKLAKTLAKDVRNKALAALNAALKVLNGG